MCLITDGRPIIVYAQAWRVKYVTVSDLCLVLTPNALMAVRNLKAVYHLVRYAGCRGNTRYLVRWVTNHDRTGYVARRTMQSCCGPGDCLGFCDKSFFGISVRGHVGRFAAAQCGHKEVDSWTFVDNFMHSCPILWHEFCAGLAQGCPICLAALEKLLWKSEALDHMMLDCALVFSTKKGTCRWRSDKCFGSEFQYAHN